MFESLSRRDLLKAVAAGALASALPAAATAGPIRRVLHEKDDDGTVSGHMTGAARPRRDAARPRASSCVFGIPGAQENELWDDDEEPAACPTCSSPTSSRPRAWPTATPAAPAGPASSASCPARASPTR